MEKDENKTCTCPPPHLRVSDGEGISALCTCKTEKPAVDKPSGEGDMRFFSFDPNGDGYKRHATGKEARESALKSLRGEKEVACSEKEWDEDVFFICWGEITQIVKETSGPDYQLVNIAK